jgi:hypothetical protein
MPRLHLQLLGVSVAFDAQDSAALGPVADFFGEFETGDPASSPDIVYRLGPGYRVTRDGMLDETPQSLGRMLYLIDKDLTIELEQRRQDLYFLHAAALASDKGVLVLAGDSGNGKSTTCWALTQHGFGYLSDELAPIEPASCTVVAFPRAIGLKAPPPAPYLLPESTLNAGQTLHVPARDLPAVAPGEQLPLAALIFVRYSPDLAEPQLRPVSPGTAAATLYTHALNPLAHPRDGLGVVTEIARRRPAVELLTAELGASCELVAEYVATL